MAGSDEQCELGEEWGPTYEGGDGEGSCGEGGIAEGGGLEGWYGGELID